MGVKERIAFFNCRAETATTMSLTTTPATTTTATATTSVAGISSGVGSDPYGLNYARNLQGAMAMPNGGPDEIFANLEYEVKFARDELEGEIDDIIEDLEDEEHTDAKRKWKKSSVLVDMMGAERQR